MARWSPRSVAVEAQRLRSQANFRAIGVRLDLSPAQVVDVAPVGLVDTIFLFDYYRLFGSNCSIEDREEKLELLKVIAAWFAAVVRDLDGTGVDVQFVSSSSTVTVRTEKDTRAFAQICMGDSSTSSLPAALQRLLDSHVSAHGQLQRSVKIITITSGDLNDQDRAALVGVLEACQNRMNQAFPNAKAITFHFGQVGGGDAGTHVLQALAADPRIQRSVSFTHDWVRRPLTTLRWVETLLREAFGLSPRERAAIAA